MWGLRCARGHEIGAVVEALPADGSAPAGLTVADVVAVHSVPGVSPEVAALVEPSSVAVMALHRAGARRGDPIVVPGAGPIGSGLVLCA